MSNDDTEFAALLAYITPPPDPDQRLCDEIKALVNEIGDQRIRCEMFNDVYVSGGRRALVRDGMILLLGETGVASERGVWVGYTYPVVRVLNPADIGCMDTLRAYLIETAGSPRT